MPNDAIASTKLCFASYVAFLLEHCIGRNCLSQGQAFVILASDILKVHLRNGKRVKFLIIKTEEGTKKRREDIATEREEDRLKLT